jgi:arsenate reductase-like glutaredoxin family protein
MNQRQWNLYGSTYNPSSQIARDFLDNHALPYEYKGIYRITREEIAILAGIHPGGAKALAYPTGFAFSLVNPQRAKEKGLVDEIHQGKLSEEEVIDKLANHPYLIITPIVANGEKIIIGYDYNEMVKTFRNVKVKEIDIA